MLIFEFKITDFDVDFFNAGCKIEGLRDKIGLLKNLLYVNKFE